MPGPRLWPVLGNMPQTLAFLRQEAHPHHVLWTTFANKYGGIYRCSRLQHWPRPLAGLHACPLPHAAVAQSHASVVPVRLHIPGSRFVVVSDPDILPAIIGRPGLPKWAAYGNVVPVGPDQPLIYHCSFVPSYHESLSLQLVARSKVHTLFTTPHSSDPTWRAIRKALNPAFSPAAIRCSAYPVQFRSSASIT